MPELTQEQIHQLFVLVNEYMSILEIKNPIQKKLQFEKGKPPKETEEESEVGEDG